MGKYRYPGTDPNAKRPAKEKASKHAFVRCTEGDHYPAAPFILRCVACQTTYCRRHPHACAATRPECDIAPEREAEILEEAV